MVLYLGHQDVVAADVVHSLVCLPLQLGGELDQDPAPVGHTLSLQSRTVLAKQQYGGETKEGDNGETPVQYGTGFSPPNTTVYQ